MALSRPLAAASQALAGESEQTRLKLALESAGDAVFDWTPGDDRMAWTGDAGGLFAGVETGAAFQALVRNRDGDAAGRPDGAYALTYEVVPPKGGLAYVEEHGLRLPGPEGRTERVIGLVRVVTPARLREMRLERLATYDELTGTLTRARLKDKVAEALAQGGAHALLVCAIDGLAGINGTYGFAVADEVIVAAGRRIAAVAGGGAAIGRVSGNKFGVLFPCSGPDEIAQASEALREALRSSFIETSSGPVLATVSVGALALPFAAERAEDAMVRVEEALDRAKASGRDGFHFFQPSDERESERRRAVALGEEIVAALNENRVTLAYQPIVCARTGATQSFEALLRLKRPDGGIVAAGEFIPAAERLGLVRLLDQRALELTVETLRRQPNARISFNISAVTAADRALLDRFVAFVAGHQSVAPRLTVELTETAAIHDLDESARFVERLRALGAKVAIDDFGAGYTSFRNLQQLKVDCVKIDGSFVKGLAHSRDNQAFVKALVDLAKNFGLTVVAEWVSGPEDAAVLRAFGVDLFQGFFYGKPALNPVWDPEATPAAPAR